jgi:hypothetical protein
MLKNPEERKRARSRCLARILIGDALDLANQDVPLLVEEGSVNLTV